jgi:hypothetical protein
MITKTLCPRFENDIDAIKWLRDNVPEHYHFYDTVLHVLASPILDGIPVFGEEVKEMLEQINKTPVWLGDKVFEIDVKPRSLYWELQDNFDEMLSDLMKGNDMPEFESEFTAEKYYAATALLTTIIDTNVSATYVFSSVESKQFAKTLKILTRNLERIQASLIKVAATEIANKKDIVGIRGRHITLDRSFRNFLAPVDILQEVLKKPQIVRSIVVVNGDTAYTCNLKGVRELLQKFGINGIKRVVRLHFKDMKKLIEFDPNNDTIIGHVFRHPIIGYIGVGTVQPANINGIGVPADVAEKLDGDDDGDIIDLVPSIIVKNKKFSFATTVLDL